MRIIVPKMTKLCAPIQNAVRFLVVFFYLGIVRSLRPSITRVKCIYTDLSNQAID